MEEAETKIQRYDTYKDSGEEWLGEIPEHWEVLPLFALTKLKSITNNNGLELLSVYLDRGVIRFSDVTAKRTNVTSLDLSKYQLVEPGDFVLNNQQAWRGSVGVSNYTGIVSPAYIVLSLSNNLNPIFANYLFRDGSMVSQYLINSKGVGTIQRNLYWPSLRRSSISLPPLSEQTQIAQFLDDKTTKIEDAIAIKQQQINLLKERKQILIHKAVTRGLDDSVTLKDSGVEWIGEIPEHWEVKRVKHLLDERTERSKDGEEPLLMMSQIHGLVVRSEFHSKAEVAQNSEGNKIVKKNDLVFNKLKAHLGVFFKSNIDFDGIVSPDYAVYYSKGVISDLKFLEILFRNPEYIKEFICRATGIVEGLIRLYTSDLFDIHVAVPPKGEQKEILDYIETVSQKIETAIGLKQQEIVKLKEYKGSLINGVVTGKVRVC
ncbi:MAG: restriction endonuclease subunit S [Polaribacter sp.]|uniref:restriction endonuclease subunit S n=1 Tax=Polaribacter sp. TaxID=1920175 RepID=UPI003EFA8546